MPSVVDDHDAIVKLSVIVAMLVKNDERQDKRLRFMEKYYWMGVGALMFIELLHTSDVWVKFIK